MIEAGLLESLRYEGMKSKERRLYPQRGAEQQEAKRDLNHEQSKSSVPCIEYSPAILRRSGFLQRWMGAAGREYPLYSALVNDALQEGR